MKKLISASAATASAGLSVLCASNIKRIHRLRKAGILSRTEAIASYAVAGGGAVMYAVLSAACVKDTITDAE